jgi:nucleoside-diphosphate-sugar epimerase
MSAGPRVLVTGAAGFLGAAAVAALPAAGAAARAAVRRAAPGAPWADDPGVERVALDLAAGDAAALDAALDGVSAVIHAAAGAGDDAAHARDTVAATGALIAAMARRAAPPRLVLVSSFAVYNYASLPAWSTLDETTPLEPEPAMRDAYCRAKLAQEAQALRAAQALGIETRVMRPGAIWGEGRWRSARLGLRAGPLLLRVGDPPVPAVHVADCAAALALAAVAPMGGPGDAPVLDGGAPWEAYNVVDPDAPTVSAWLAAAPPSARPRLAPALPPRLARAPALAVGLVGALAPGVARRAPGPLRPESFDARFKPLRYSAARLEDRLGWRAARPLAAAGAPS